jgi:VanZ family protein
LFVSVTALVVFAGILVPVRAQVALETFVIEVMLGFAALFGWHDATMQATIAGSAMVSKLGHLVGFALLGFGLRWMHPRENRWLLMGSLLVVAAVSEALQFFVDGRSPQLIDFYVDAAGLVLGVAAFAGLRRGIPAYFLGR